MSEEIPPNVPVFQNLDFNNNFFISSSNGLTYDQLTTKFLTYPVAQGTETLQDTIINGDLNANYAFFGDKIVVEGPSINNREIATQNYIIRDLANNGITNVSQNSSILSINNVSSVNPKIITKIKDVNVIEIDPNEIDYKRPLLMNDNVASNRSIFSTYYNLYNTLSGVITQNGLIYNTNGNFYLQNTTNGGTFNIFLNDISGVQYTPFQILASTGNLFNRPVTIASNQNLNMNAGTGIINQTGLFGDINTQNQMKRTVFSMTSNQPNGIGTSVVDCVDNTTGTGLYVLPNSGQGSLGLIAQRNDTLIGSRNLNKSCLTLMNYNEAMKNGIRIFTTDISNCGLHLHCGGVNWLGQANIADFKMEYNKTTNIVNTSFNNSIDFNPPGTINTKRQIFGLGTLGFTDISSSLTTNGFNGYLTSRIWTDSLSISGGVVGMYYDCSIPNSYHIFSVRDGAGNISTPVYYGNALTSFNNTIVIRSSQIPSNRLDIVTDSTNNTNIRARSVTASTAALINFNADIVNAGGTVTNAAVMTLASSRVEIKRPIQFNYLSNPNASTQLGYIENYNLASNILVSTSTSTRNLGSFTIANPGTYNIELMVGLLGTGTHTLSECTFGFLDISNTLPSITVPNKYCYSLTGHTNIILNTSVISYLKSNFNINFTTSQTLWCNYRLQWSGGGSVEIDTLVQSTRIG